MIMSNQTIQEKFVKSSAFDACAFNMAQIGPASVDLTLGRRFYREKLNQVIDLSKSGESVNYDFLEQDSLILEPGEFILATTQEAVYLDEQTAGIVMGKSSIGRLGLQIQNAGYVDPGFKGKITLELMNQCKNKIMIHAGMDICQVVFFILDKPTHQPYNGKYQNQMDVQHSKHLGA